MFRIIAVTNRHQCSDNFEERLTLLARSGVDSIILREKDLSHDEYGKLVRSVLRVVEGTGVKLIAHQFADAARVAGCKSIHLPFEVLKDNPSVVRDFDRVGVSVHSLEEARQAFSSGAHYLIAGHIFATDCKGALPPRGLSFLNEIICEKALPIYAIGGITEKNIAKIRESGADGACLMSSLMSVTNPFDYINSLQKACRII